MLFIRSFSSEWLKTRRTAAAWLVVTGALFIPLIILASRIIESQELAEANASAELWIRLMQNCWQVMAIFLLPLGVIMATSLITQNEFRNNAWKQLHTTPQPLYMIYSAKLAVILVMLLQFFVLFNIGIYLAGVIPGLFFSGVSWPNAPFPLADALTMTAHYFLCCLPVVAVQFLISLQARNFLIPLGIGIGLLVSSIIAMHWKYGYVHPYAYSGLYFIRSSENPAIPDVSWWALGYFILTITAGYIAYISRKEKV
jgi:lantibiotic transport system permease protein